MLRNITASFDERMRLLLDPHYVSASPVTSSAASSSSSASVSSASRKASAEDAALVAMGKKRDRGTVAEERSASVGGSPRQKLITKVSGLAIVFI